MNDTHIILVYPKQEDGKVGERPAPEFVNGKEDLLYKTHELTKHGYDFKIWELGNLVGDFVRLIGGDNVAELIKRCAQCGKDIRQDGLYYRHPEVGIVCEHCPEFKDGGVS